ncbi:DUF6879 family protein [Amycolatopsis alba]|uniref:DUF6879 family protein n=1 Tax=Amycolatopsis alba TaxID=76020 RepID=UPI0012F789BD|nr:DUF6879 family protein [Amycolatopsis alba]
MLDFLGAAPGVRLTQDAYNVDYNERFDRSPSQSSWKLERRQDFRQPGHARWEAFARGDWDEALRLTAELRPAHEKLFREAADRGIDLFRLRVIERPLTPYVHWELYSLKMSAESGEKIRVVGSEAVVEYEQDGLLPELLTVGPDVVYEILYEESGTPNGGIRYDGVETMLKCNDFIEKIYEKGEDLISYFDREIAHLPPPGRV